MLITKQWPHRKRRQNEWEGEGVGVAWQGEDDITEWSDKKRSRRKLIKILSRKAKQSLKQSQERYVNSGAGSGGGGGGGAGLATVRETSKLTSHWVTAQTDRLKELLKMKKVNETKTKKTQTKTKKKIPEYQQVMPVMTL